MVFSSIPVYSDHPNWHQLQQPTHEQGIGGGGGDSHQLPPPPQPAQMAGGGGAGSIRPGSMVDRARLANLPLPEAGLKCPRCDSTNTKFCYFNNYSLSQPRHFCKTCRRYWTRGGGLRNVPVGGGCRRNKRSSKSSGGSGSKSKSSPASERASGSNSAGTASPSSCGPDMSAHFTQLPLFSALQNLSPFAATGSAPIGSNINVFHHQLFEAAAGRGGEPSDHLSFQIAGTNSGGNDLVLSTTITDQCRFPFVGGFEPPAGIFPFQNEGPIRESQLGSMAASSGGISQLAPLKVEDNNNQGFNLSMRLMGMSENNQYWNGNPWTEFSSVSSSSTNHFL